MCQRTTWGRKLPLTVTAAVSLLLVSCGSPDPVADSIEELEDRTFRVQAIYGPDHSASVALEAFAEEVSEETNGAIEFDITYSVGLVDVPEQEEAIDSGLLHMALLYPLYSPDLYPISNIYSDLAFQGPQTPLVGLLVEFAAAAEAGFHPAHMDELRSRGGIEPILPMNGTVPNYHLLCTDTAVTDRDSAEGLRVRVSGQGYADEVRALGMQPVQLAGPEIYEGLERGAVDCNLGALGLNHSQGLVDLVDHYTIDSQTPFLGWNTGAWGLASDQWEQLPVDAQRVIWDATVETYIPTVLDEVLLEVSEEIQYAIDAGVEFHEMDEDSHQALEDHRESLIDEKRDEANEALPEEYDGDEFINAYIDAYDRWTAIVEDLGYSDTETPTYDRFTEEYGTDTPDLTPYYETLREEIFDAHRP